MSADDEGLTGEFDLSEVSGTSAAALLSSVAERLEDAPTTKRYDVELSIKERDDDEF